MSSPPADRNLPYLVMVFSPLFFSTNLVFGRFLAGEISPFLLATIRWGSVALVLSPFIFRRLPAVAALVRSQWRLLAILGILGMGVCGGGIYFALHYTTATNATLIYTASPVLILLIERAFFGRRSNLREIVGIGAAFLGVVVIVVRGSLDALLSLSLNIGDVIVFAAAVSWAAYSILYRAEHLRMMNNMTLLGLVAMFGALANLPFAIGEIAKGDALPTSLNSWMAVGGVVLFPSLLAYSTYQYGIRTLGAALTGVFMYLLPPYGVFLAVLTLGENFKLFHLLGIALVMSGVVLATFPSAALRIFYSRGTS